jgi:hypothetical protein
VSESVESVESVEGAESVEIGESWEHCHVGQLPFVIRESFTSFWHTTFLPARPADSAALPDSFRIVPHCTAAHL